MSRIYTSRRQPLALSLENENTDNEPKKGEMEEHADGLEAEVGDVEQASSEIEAGDDQVAEAVEGAEALESMCVILATAMEAGGIDQHGAALVNNQVEHICARLGLESRDATLGLESFGGVSGRQRSTQVAMESIKDKVKEIWEKIIAAIERAMKWVADLFNKLFGAVEGLEKRAKKLIEQSDAAQGKSAKEKKFENEALAKKLAIGKDVDGVKSSNVYKELVVALPESEASEERFSKGMIGSLEKAANGDLEGAYVAFKDMPTESQAAIFKKEIVSNPKEEGFTVGDDTVLARTPELPGRMAICVSSSKAAGDASKPEAANMREAFASMNIFFGPYSPKKMKDSVSKDLNTLSPSDVEKICGQVIEAAAALKKVRGAASKRYDWKKKALEASKKLANRDAKEGESEDDKQYYAAFRTLAAKVPRMIDEPLLTVAKYGVTTGQALLAYCELSLRQYK